MTKKFWLLLLLLWSGAELAFAQPTQPVRLELEANYYTSAIQIKCLPDSTLLVYERKAGRRMSDLTHYFRRYNHTLNQLWITAAVSLPAESYYGHVWATRRFAYYLFPVRRSAEFSLIQITLASGEVQISRHELPSEMKIEDMKALDEQIFITATDHNKLAVFHLDLHLGKLLFVPSLFNSPGALSDFRADSGSSRFEFAISETFRNMARVQVKRYTPRASHVSSVFIHPQQGKNLTAARLAPGDSASKLVIGAYTLRDLRFGQGFFTRPLFTNDPVRFFDFTTFTHFFDYMPQGRKTRVGRRIERYQQRRQVLKLRYRLLLHEVMVHPDGYLLVAEAYYPKYRSESIIQRPEYRIFEGFWYTHAIICLFDHTGNLLWDNSLPVKNVLQPTLKPTVQACPVPGGAIMAYTKDEQIFYKHILPENPTGQYQSISVLPYHSYERIAYTEEAGLQHWYDRNFLAFGYQKITSRHNQSRYVFYLNKIAF